MSLRTVPPRSAESTRWRMGLRETLLLAIVIAIATATTDELRSHVSFFDLGVYRRGALEVLHGTGHLYDFRIQVYPFTYPPFAGIALLPMAWLSPTAIKVVWTALLGVTLVLVWWASFRAGTRGDADRRVPTGPFVALGVGLSAYLFEPVAMNFHFGQVNLFLVLFILLDLVGRMPERWRGVLTGLAAAFKLTPLVFLVFLALTRQWRALRNAVAAFVAAAALGFVVLPRESWRYWTDLLPDSSRIGPMQYARNQSVMGMLVRAGADRNATSTTMLWLLIAGVLGCVSMGLAVWCWHRGEQLLAVSLVGLVALFASPISWTHHWVWCIPLGVGLASATRRWTGDALRGWFVAGAWWAIFVIAPHANYPRGGMVELSWNPFEQLFGVSYLWVSALMLGYVAWQLRVHGAAAAVG